jgi:hypothetical protein
MKASAPPYSLPFPDRNPPLGVFWMAFVTLLLLLVVVVEASEVEVLEIDVRLLFLFLFLLFLKSGVSIWWRELRGTKLMES